VWLLLHYFFPRDGEFGPGPNPAEPLWLVLHGAFGFLATWTVGLLTGLHVLRAWRTRRSRWSGSVLFGSALLLIFSGFLLYYVGSDAVRPYLSIGHWALGLAAPLFYLVHRLRNRRA
jgi:hypothetical protein